MEECSNNGGKRKTNHSFYYDDINYSNSNNICYNNNKSKNEIRKGPWKPEEDQVILAHVHKYGPCDWSSIRSKGLLLRTGKSCRLRWVNKLQPNLKHGCKFTSEEEKVVIDMQEQIGNKWATIAKHLPGRTDNDVKNFWSSRQKRLARILYSQSPSHKRSKFSDRSFTSTSKDHPQFIKVPGHSPTEGETSRAHSLNSSYHDNTDKKTKKMVPISDSINNYGCSSFEANSTTYLEPIPLAMYCNNTDLLQLEEPSFPSIPYLETDISFPLETQEFIDRLDSSFFSPFGCTIEPGFLDEWTSFPAVSGGETSGVKREIDNPETPDSFSDDLPSDMFD